ncbi:MAG TPA: Clp protease N-terminal domain-containing protein [Candidatus Elarobacter sp.]|nr:Clp protease N-terminal domain-containing protein [Candidatus Elarobacter sp.]
MTDGEQLRLDPALIDVMRAGVTAALDHGAEFVAPAHLLLGLLADPQVGPAIDPLVPRDHIAEAAEDAAKKLPEVAELPEGALPGTERAPFARYDSLAFRSQDGSRTMYLDGDAYHVFIEGARRAGEVYRPKHLVYGFTAEAVKDRDLLSLFGSDPQSVTKAVDTLP